MNWNRSRFDYYFDFALVPCIVMAMLVIALVSWQAMVCGILLWTFIEYWIHRILFHRVFKRNHWQHHQNPGGFVAAPSWITAIGHGSAFTLFGLLPWPEIGAGLFVGLELGYLAYIVTHDRIHHAKRKPNGWFRRRWEMHMMHHHGMEKNFGVYTNIWDRVFGTYWGAKWRPVLRG